jgi:hypothetical protein
MSSRLQLTAFFGKRVPPVFSVAYAVLLHSFAHPRNSSRFLSTVCALFMKTSGVLPLAATVPAFWILVSHLFSYPYKTLFPQLLSFDVPTKPPGGGGCLP